MRFSARMVAMSGRLVRGSLYFAQKSYTLHHGSAVSSQCAHSAMVMRLQASPVCHGSQRLDVGEAVHPAQTHLLIQLLEHLRMACTDGTATAARH